MNDDQPHKDTLEMALRAVSMIDQQEPQYAPLPPIIGGVE